MSGTRDLQRLIASMHPTSSPVSLSSFHLLDPIQDGPLESPSLSNKYVQYVQQAAKNAQEYPPKHDPRSPTPAAPRNRFNFGSREITRHIPRPTGNGSEVDIVKGERRDARKNKKEWRDLPYNNNYSKGSRFLLLPPNILDLILGSDSLHLRDYLALAATSKSVRACFYTAPLSHYSPLWRTLIALRPMLEQGRQNVKKLKQPEIAKTIEEIWSNGLKVDKARMKVIREERDDEREGATGKKRKRKEESDLAIRSNEWETAIDLVHTTRLSKNEAKKLYKVSEKELNNYLSCFVAKGRGGSQRQLYIESAVESLALRLHGGVQGHKEHVARLAEIARRANITRQHNLQLQGFIVDDDVSD